ncbi:MAG: glycosyltransferase [Anaerotruncus sp.]|nr:glycosyltransferase [Anaerotruncus sp.]
MEESAVMNIDRGSNIRRYMAEVKKITCVPKEVPLFSVIVLTYMQRHLLEPCIDSILIQDYPNIEIIISDDCSADFNPDEVRSYILNRRGRNIRNIIVVKQTENVGTSKNARLGIQLASGVFFKLHAGDDMLYSQSVLSMMAKYLKKPSVNIIAARSRACQHDGTMTEEVYPAYDAISKMMDANAQEQFEMMATQSWGEYINAPAVFWRRDFYEKIGGFDPKYKYTEDWPMWLKITKAGYRITSVNELSTIYRYGGISNDQSDINASLGKEHYDECIRMLEEEALPVFQQKHQKMKGLRCKQAIWCIQARIICETQWNHWSVLQKVIWKCQNAKQLLLAWLYRRRTWGTNISVYKEIIAALGIGVFYHFHIQLWPVLEFDTFWALLFFVVLAFLALKIAILLSVKCVIKIIPFIKRGKK